MRKLLKQCFMLFICIVTIFSFSFQSYAENNEFEDENNNEITFYESDFANERSGGIEETKEDVGEIEEEELIVNCTHSCEIGASHVSSSDIYSRIRLDFFHNKSAFTICNEPMYIEVYFVVFNRQHGYLYADWRKREVGYLSPYNSTFEIFSAPEGYTLEYKVKTTVHGVTDETEIFYYDFV